VQAATTGQHDDANPTGLADRVEHVPAVHLGQVHIQDDQAVGVVLEQVQRIDTITCPVNDIATFGKPLLKIFGSFGFVFHY